MVHRTVLLLKPTVKYTAKWLLRSLQGFPKCAVDYTTLHCTSPHCTSLHLTALHLTAPHCTAKSCTAPRPAISNWLFQEVIVGPYSLYCWLCYEPGKGPLPEFCKNPQTCTETTDYCRIVILITIGPLFWWTFEVPYNLLLDSKSSWSWIELGLAGICMSVVTE